MDAVPQYRQFAYALLATAVAFVVWLERFDAKDGIWIMIGAIALFGVLAFLDGVIVGRVRQRGESGPREPGDGDPGT